MTAVVREQGVPVGRPVVFDGEPGIPEIQIDSRYEVAVGIEDRNLRFRPGQAGIHQQQAQPGFHRRFGPAVGQIRDSLQSRNALGATVGGDPIGQLGASELVCVQCHVGDDHGFRQWQAPSQVAEGPAN